MAIRNLTKRELINAKNNGQAAEDVIDKELNVTAMSFVEQDVTNLETGERQKALVSFMMLDDGSFVSSPSPFLQEALFDIQGLADEENLDSVKIKIVKRKAKRIFYSAILVD